MDWFSVEVCTGLHDTANGLHFVPAEDILKALKEALRKLKKTEKKPPFAVQRNSAFSFDPPSWLMRKSSLTPLIDFREG